MMRPRRILSHLPPLTRRTDTPRRKGRGPSANRFSARSKCRHPKKGAPRSVFSARPENRTASKTETPGDGLVRMKGHLRPPLARGRSRTTGNRSSREPDGQRLSEGQNLLMAPAASPASGAKRRQKLSASHSLNEPAMWIAPSGVPSGDTSAVAIAISPWRISSSASA